MVFHHIIIRFVFAILLVWSSSISISFGATKSTKCDQYCGAANFNAQRVPYPFGFTEGCQIHLNCTETGEIRLGEYLVQNVTSDTLMVNFPVNCSRPIEDLKQFSGTNYGMTWRNGLLLKNCTVPRSECSIPSELLSTHLNIPSCDSRKENVSCYSEGSADYLDYLKLRNTGCGNAVSSILVGMDNNTKKSSVMYLEFQTLELAWGLEGDCACDNDGICTNILFPGNRKRFRCRCKDGFEGDGFRDGDGCRKEYAGNNESNNLDEDDKLVSLGFYVSMATGYILVFWGIIFTLILNQSCRISYFQLLTDIINWVLVTAILSHRRLKKLWIQRAS